jgi:coenzyme F420 hydrogenase subunit beta
MLKSCETLKSVLENNLCVGCGACSVTTPEKIKLNLNSEGYLRPFIKEGLTEQEENNILKICPGVSVDSAFYQQSKDKLWGPIVNSFVGWSSNDELRHKASSGGAITSIATSLLSQGEVDAVLHTGVDTSDPLKNRYQISTNPEDVMKHAGSRYAPAAPLEGLFEAIKNYKRIAFIGKPCDVVAVRKICEIDEEVREKIYCCISFMCAGVPSLKGTHAVLKALEVDVEDVKWFQYRGDGWPGQAKVTTHEDISRGMSYDNSWGKILNRHLQFRCKICIDGTGESADITCADAWHGDTNGYPSFDEQQGRSLILIRTEHGRNILSRVINNDSLVVEPIDVTELQKMQPYQASRKSLALSRLLALATVNMSIPKYNLRMLLSLSKKSSLKENVKSYLGTLTRALKLRKL